MRPCRTARQAFSSELCIHRQPIIRVIIMTIQTDEHNADLSALISDIRLSDKIVILILIAGLPQEIRILIGFLHAIRMSVLSSIT